MLQAHFSRGLRNGAVAPCLFCRKNARGLRLAALLLACLLLMPAVLGIGVHGRPVLAAAAQQEANPVEIDVTVEDGVLAVNVRSARLEDVFRAIAERAGLRLRLAGDLGRPITVWFTLRLEEGLRQLVGDSALIMIYEPARGQAGQLMLTEIRVSGSPDGHVVTIEPAVKESSLDQVYDGLDRFDRKSKLRAVRELHGLDDETAIDDLALVLAQETDSKVRRLAAFGLGNSSGNANAFAALSAALGDKDRSVRFQAIHGLSKIGGRESAEALTITLRDHDPAVRLQTVLALQRIGDVGTVGVLTKVLGDDEDPEVRRVAVRTLERMGGDEAWWALFDATSDPNPTVRKAAATAIGR